MFILGTLLLAVVTALACALPGVFVVLRKKSMVVDGIGHAVFPGIVVGYLLTRDLNSPLLVLGAALAGLLVVLGADWLSKTRMIAGDAPLGLIFPALFAVGVILVSSRLTDLHLASFDRLVVGDVDLGPSYLYVMLAVVALNAAFLVAFYPQLQAATFDPGFARLLGVRTGVLDTAFMFLVSVTVTAAFHAAGALLIIALVVTPAATAQIFAVRMGQLIAWTLAFAGLGAGFGFGLAYALDASTSAGMAVFYGLQFAATLIVHRMAGSRGRTAVPAR